MNMSDMTKKLYPVTGMHCAACAGNVEKIVRKHYAWFKYIKLRSYKK